MAIPLEVALSLSLSLAPALAHAREPSDLDLRRIELSPEGARAPALEGNDSHRLTLDVELQRRTDEILAGARARAGAIVLAEVKTGRILAWASRGAPVDLVRTPVYPPASLLKVATAAALLERSLVDRGTRVCFSGGLRGLAWDDVAKLCRPGEPRIGFGEALGRSINVVFGRLAVAHDASAPLTEIARALGLTGAPPFELGAPESVVAAPESPLALARTAAGFVRDARVSPLSVLAMMQTIAHDGVPLRLRLIDDGSPPMELDRAVGRATARALAKMLAVTTTGGTARRAFRPRPGRPSYRAAGKTGTLSVGPPRRLLSWFAGFAPADDPEVAVAVLLANDPRWWRKGHEVARDVLDAYFAGR